MVSGPTSPASDLEARIDALYQLPLGEFTAARNALAKALAGPDRDRVKRLIKPAVVPWIVNQIHWSARSVYDRLLEAGSALRRAQVAAMERPGTTGRQSKTPRDRRADAAAVHQDALAHAVHQARRLAGAAGVPLPTDVLTRMLDALSLAPQHPGDRGRLTAVVAPTGFGVFAGLVPHPPAQGVSSTPSTDRPGTLLSGRAERAGSAPTPHDVARARREAEARADRRARATRGLDAAQHREALCRQDLADAERAQHSAARELARLTARADEARTALSDAVRAREAAEHALTGF